MKKSLTVLSAAVLLLAAAGCSSESGPDSTASAGASATDTASASAPVSPGAAGTASPSPSAVALAEGFPEALLPVMDGALIRSSTVESTETKVIAVLVESVDAAPAEVFAFYDGALAPHGFTPAESAAGAPASRDYLRTTAAEPETVNVTVSSKDGGPSIVTVGATVLAESAK